jgi:lipoyl(octanoyl) transferase
VVYEEALRWQRLLASARAEDVDRRRPADRGARPRLHGRPARRPRDERARHPARHPRRRGRARRDVTYHGPGQLVAYPIVALPHAKAVRPYVEALEAACVAVAASFGIEARPDRERTGVWVGEEKLVAIGIRVDRGVTFHGLALNVDPDLDDFAGIVPCGIADRGVCSLASLGVETTMAEVRRRLVDALARTLGRTVQPARPQDLGLTVGGG